MMTLEDLRMLGAAMYDAPRHKSAFFRGVAMAHEAQNLDNQLTEEWVAKVIEQFDDKAPAEDLTA